MYPMTITSETFIIMPTPLTLQEYAAAHNVHPRTVKRWLGERELPGAEQDDKGRWSIPATAVRTPKQQVTLPRREPQNEVEHVVVAEKFPDLDTFPASFFTLEQAAHILQLTPRAIAGQADYFELIKLTVDGVYRWMMPMSTIKKIRGIR